MELSQKQKEKIVEELNSESEEQSSGNTSLFTMANMEELKPFLQELTPMDMFDKSVALNQTTIANLADLLPRLSKKNLIRLFFATLKLPEKGANLKFGGKQQEQQLCEMAYANSQMARNALIHILGTTAIAQARLVKKKENELKEQESVEVTEDKGESK
jgi:hypothetical protein